MLQRCLCQKPFNSRFSLNRFPVCFNLFVLFFLVTQWSEFHLKNCRLTWAFLISSNPREHLAFQVNLINFSFYNVNQKHILKSLLSPKETFYVLMTSFFNVTLYTLSVKNIQSQFFSPEKMSAWQFPPKKFWFLY